MALGQINDIGNLYRTGGWVGNTPKVQLRPTTDPLAPACA